ncbi:MAG: HAD family hydrolase [Erysipelotrichaceae bacterium]|nr:HAD family hydrolase [Erysipelotrichaceae bacterium]
MKKIFFIDIDGTILDHTRGMHHVSEKTKYALKELNKDHHVYIASGRCRCLLAEEVLSLSCDGLLLDNGAFAENENGSLFSEVLSLRELEEIAAVCEKNGAVYYFETEEKIYTNGIGGKIHHDFNENWEIPEEIYSGEDYHGKEIHMVMIACSSEEEKEKMQELLGGRFDCRTHHDFPSFDLSLYGMSKGRGVRRVLEKLCIRKEDAYAFGDGLNDLEMMQEVGHGIAMANAFPQIKEIASEFTDDVLDDGLYRYLVRNHFIAPLDVETGKTVLE